MKSFVLALALFLVGCDTYIKTPVTVRSVYYAPEGTVCWLSLELEHQNSSRVWTTASAENCQYKKGDILK